MIYTWKYGAHTAKLNAQRVGERLELLRERNGQLTAQITVDDARPPESLMHPHFEWNDQTAADEYRLEQARSLIRSVVVLPDDEGDLNRKPVRAFVVISEFGEQGYTSTYLAMSDEVLRKQVLARALRELQQWEERYHELQELAELMTTTKRFRETVSV